MGGPSKWCIHTGKLDCRRSTFHSGSRVALTLVVCVAPIVVSRISLSVSLGALVPVSLFEMDYGHPVTISSKHRYNGTKTGILEPVKTYGVQDSESIYPSSLLGLVGLVIDKLQPLPTSIVPALAGRRVSFDISATHAGRRGVSPQLAEAIAAFVGRSGARLATDVHTADWLVVSERSGDAYWHVSLSALMS